MMIHLGRSGRFLERGRNKLIGGRNNDGLFEDDDE